jgi:CRP-like cAMP-binding protein
MPPTKERADIERLLAQQPFLRGLDGPQMELLIDCAGYTQYEPGQFICREGDRADHFHLIHHGRVALEMSQEENQVAVQSLEAGDVLGWSWLVPPYRWRFNARAVEATNTLALDAKRLRNHCEENHELGYQLLIRLVQVMTQRLETTRHQLQANSRLPR